MIVILMLLVLSQVQDSPEALVRRLGDDSIEARERATAELLKLGESARLAIEKGTADSDPEVKTRSVALLQSLDLLRDVRHWVGEPVKVTVTGEVTLKEAIGAFQKQAGMVVSIDEWPEGRFKVEIRELPVWEALEGICKASGKRTLSITMEGPKLIGDRWVNAPMTVNRNCVVRFDSIRFLQTRSFETNFDSSVLTLTLSVGWPKRLLPAKISLNFTALEDDLGKSLLSESPNPALQTFFASPLVPVEPRPANGMLFPYSTALLPPPTSEKLKRVEGAVNIWIRVAAENVNLSAAAASTDRISICGSDLTETRAVEIALSSPARVGNLFKCDVQLRGFEDWMLKELGGPWRLKDKSGRVTAAITRSRKWDEFARTVGLGLEFQNLPEGAVPDSVSIDLPRKVVALEIPFSLKDIPLK